MSSQPPTIKEIHRRVMPSGYRGWRRIIPYLDREIAYQMMYGEDGAICAECRKAWPCNTILSYRYYNEPPSS